jgi:hypothetical protein
VTAADEQRRLREHAARWAEYWPQLDAMRPDSGLVEQQRIFAKI